MKYIEHPNPDDFQADILFQLVVAWRNERLFGYLKNASIALESLEIYQLIAELLPVIDTVSDEKRRLLLHKTSLIIDAEFKKRRKTN